MCAQIGLLPPLQDSKVQTLTAAARQGYRLINPFGHSSPATSLEPLHKGPPWLSQEMFGSLLQPTARCSRHAPARAHRPAQSKGGVDLRQLIHDPAAPITRSRRRSECGQEMQRGRGQHPDLLDSTAYP
ncbi:hypothetical protein ACOMHN_025129 [Nucella lapillus]